MSGQSAWACVNRHGHIALDTVRAYRGDSIAAFMDDMPEKPWPWWRKRHGWRCRRVAVHIVHQVKDPGHD